MPVLVPKNLRFDEVWNDTCKPKLAALFDPKNYKKPLESIHHLCVTSPKAYVDETYSAVSYFYMEQAERIKDRLVGLTGGELLEVYAREWSIFKFAALRVDAVCFYLNKVVEKLAESTGVNATTILFKNQHVYVKMKPVGVMGLFVWKHIVLESLREVHGNPLVGAILDSVKNLRTSCSGSKDIPNDLLTILETCAKSFAECDPLEYAAPHDPMPVTEAFDKTEVAALYYECQLLGPYLEQTTSYYRDKSMEQISSTDIIHYIYFAETRIKMELLLCQRLFPANAESKIVEAVERELIKEHASKFKGDFGNLLQGHSIDDLKVVYSLLSRISDGLESLLHSFTSFINHRLADISSEVPAHDPEAFVKAFSSILKLIDKWNQRCFVGDQRFVEASKTALCTFFNGQNHHLILKTLSDFIDLSLSKGFPFDKILVNDAIYLATLIPEKEYFTQLYSIALANRLIFGKVAYWDAESELVVKMGTEFGNDIGTRLRRMMADFNTSSSLADHLHKFCGDQIDIAVLVATNIVWPLSSGHECKPYDELPPYVQIVKEVVEEIYTSTFNRRRRLSWLNHLSRLTIAFNRPGKNPIDLIVTMPQYHVLNAFNDRDSVPGKDLMEKLFITPNQLDIVVSPMIECGLLRWESAEVLLLNADFTCSQTSLNLTHFNLHSSIPEELDLIDDVSSTAPKTPAESIHTGVDLPENKKYLLQCMTVKVMKEHGRLSPARLQQLVTERVAGDGQRVLSFTPLPAHINACLDQLMDKQYVEYDQKADLYLYVP